MIPRPGSTASLRQTNLEAVLRQVRSAGGLVQAEIARRTGLSAATVTNLVRLLAERGQVAVAPTLINGRRSQLVTPLPGDGYILGVDIGRSHIRAQLVDLGHTVAGADHVRLEPGSSSQRGLELTAGLYARLLSDVGIDRSAVRHAGVGLPGPLDRANRQIGAATVLPEWMGQDLEERFAAALSLPVMIDNDANLGALGEYAWPPGREVSSLLYIRLATGVGGGLILNGQLYHGADGTAGEIGHLSLDEVGPLCRCGNRGCLEAIASVPAFLGVLSSALQRPVDVDAWVGLARDGHVTAVRLIEDLARHLGATVANVVNLINPGLVLVGGPIAAVGETLLAPLRAEVRQRAMPAATSRLVIERSRWGDDAEVYGASRLALMAVWDETSTSER
ncbi:MAG: ROK family transcriptional regulator [Propionibacteriaceae bacterium]|jgi:predicted NBD/HSP70 family sugar kinase|nr:ROK family transcriptional regulator [Propionibacteriaceae bacterium]